MTVLEAVRKYDCRAIDGWKLKYTNVYGNVIALPTVSKLGDMPVKAISINLPTKEVEITLQTVLDEI